MSLNIQIENFKSLRNCEVKLNNGLNVFIGANGSGKTNFISGLKFVKNLLAFGVNLAVAKDGGSSRVFRKGSSKMLFKIDFDFEDRPIRNKIYKTRCRWEFIIALQGREKVPYISSEIVTIYLEQEPKTIIAKIEINREKVWRCKKKLNTNFFGVHILSDKSYNSGWDTPSKIILRVDKLLDGIFKFLKPNGEISIIYYLLSLDRGFRKLNSRLNSLTDYNFIPEKAREETDQLPYVKLSSNGYGLSEIIYKLKSGSFEDKEFSINDYDDFFSNEIYYRLRDIELETRFNLELSKRTSIRIMRRSGHAQLEKINTELSSAVSGLIKVDYEINKSNGRKILTFISNSGQVFYPDQVSDGTIKWLCILVSLYTRSASFFVLEEPENYLHPWMQQRLIQIIREISKGENNDDIYILTTHSATLLNSCLPNEIKLVEVINDCTKIREINNLKELQNFLKNSQFHLGDLWVSGGLGGVPI